MVLARATPPGFFFLSLLTLSNKRIKSKSVIIKFMKNFWQDLPRPFFALAPMEAVSDVVFRQVVAHAGRPDVFFTEFTNTSSFCSPKGKENSLIRLRYEKIEQPIVAQIWGTKPDEFAQMATQLTNLGFAGIDINMGCPDKDVIKIGAGSNLIRTPDLACQIISATKSGGLPVSVKTRLGYSKPEEWKVWLKLLLEQDISNLTIHLRTKKEMSKAPSHFELIPEIIKLRNKISPKALITVNGDICDRIQGNKLHTEYNVDGIMIGRGVFANPYVFTTEPHQPTREELVSLLNLHLDLFIKYNALQNSETKYNFDSLKRFFKIYIRDFHGASELRDKLMHCKNINEVFCILRTL